MSGSTTAFYIDAVDAFARTLYLRLKQVAPLTFDDATVAVRQMHISLRHLRLEAGDFNSILNDYTASPVYARCLQHIVEDCEFALNQLATVLATYDNTTDDAQVDALKGRIASVTAKITQQEMNMASYLDSIQVHPKSTPQLTSAPHPPQHATLQDIQQRVEAMASKLLSRHSELVKNDPDALCKVFELELHRTGFSPEDVETHKPSIKAHIQQLGANWNRSCGATPTYQNVAEFEANTAPQAVHPPALPPKVPIPVHEKSISSSKAKDQVDKPSPRILATQYSFPLSSDADVEPADLSMASISTKDLVAMNALNKGLSNINLASDSPSHFPHNSPSPNMIAQDVSPSPDIQMLSASPRYQSGDPCGIAHSQPANYSRSSRLAPDGYGREIPLDAPWTKLGRRLVSLEVLDRAGLRYEACPEYVAILGRLSRDQVAHLARQSAECRAARSDPSSLPRRRTHLHHHHHHKYDEENRHQRRYQSDDDDGDDDDDDDVLHDESDSTHYQSDDDDERRSSDKHIRNYPCIVNAPSKTKTSPSTTVKPKPILKNKTAANTVRFDLEPHEVQQYPSSAPGTYDGHDRRRDRYDDSVSSSRRRRRDRRGHGSDRSYRSSGGAGNYRDRRDRGDRERNRDRDGDRDGARKKSWGDTLGAVGIGSAALLLGGVGGF